MNPAWASMGALVTALTLSCTTRVNVGIMSLAFAWIVGVYVAGFSVADVMSGFPARLFLTLAGVTLLFSMATVNGTLERVAARAVLLCRGRTGLIPIMFFFLGLGLATIGPGNIGTTALLAPTAMAVAFRRRRAALPDGHHGGAAGRRRVGSRLSPPTGVIVNGVMDRIGLSGVEWQTYLNNLEAHTILAFGAYFVFGGWRLLVSGHRGGDQSESPTGAFELQHWLTLGAIGGLLVGVVGFGTDVGMTALTGAALLSLSRATNEQQAIRGMPWGVILMVCGVTVLIRIMERTQGIDIFTSLLVRLSTPETATGVVAMVTGVVSIYSSTSGVVLPAFLPTVPGLAEGLGGFRSVGDRVRHERRRPSGRSVTAVDHRRAVSRRGPTWSGHPRPVQQAARLGIVDDRRRKRALLVDVRLAGRYAQQSLAEIGLDVSVPLAICPSGTGYGLLFLLGQFGLGLRPPLDLVHVSKNP